MKFRRDSATKVVGKRNTGLGGSPSPSVTHISGVVQLGAEVYFPIILPWVARKVPFNPSSLAHACSPSERGGGSAKTRGVPSNQNHLEERLLHQVQARTPYLPLFGGVIRAAYPKA